METKFTEKRCWMKIASNKIIILFQLEQLDSTCCVCFVIFRALLGLATCTKNFAGKLCNRITANIVQDSYALSMESAEHVLNSINVTVPHSCQQLRRDSGASMTVRLNILHLSLLSLMCKFLFV